MIVILRYVILFITFLFLNGCTFTPSISKISSPPLSKTSKGLTPLPPSPKLKENTEREKSITSKLQESAKEEKTASLSIATTKSSENEQFDIILGTILGEKPSCLQSADETSSSRNIGTPHDDITKTFSVIASLRPAGAYAPASSLESLQAGGEGEGKQSQPFLDSPRICAIFKAERKTNPEIVRPIVTEQKNGLNPVRNLQCDQLDIKNLTGGSFKSQSNLLVFSSRHEWKDTPSNRAKITYDIPITINKQVKWYLNYFTSQERETFKSWLLRSGRYITMIKKTLRDYKLPEDLAYLALIESGFNHKAYSRCHAVGIWQFIKGTGKRCGLKINWWVDERRDPEKSTIAAAKHLLDLYQEFGSWYLAMAGYNAGAGKIRWAIKKAGIKDFWHLAEKRLLRKETRNYVPKMIAATLIAKEPERYRFNNLEYLPSLAFDRVTVEDAIGLKLIASLVDTTEEEIRLFNPELKRWCTPPGVRYTLKIPIGKGDIFKKRLARMDTKKRMTFTVHRVKKGETLSNIARRYGNSVILIKDFNRLSSIHKIRAGRTLIIPIRYKKKEVLAKREIEHIDRNKKTVYIVQKGDTLYKIARKYKIDLSELRKWNNLTDGNSIIRPGEILVLASAPKKLSTL